MMAKIIHLREATADGAVTEVRETFERPEVLDLFDLGPLF